MRVGMASGCRSKMWLEGEVPGEARDALFAEEPLFDPEEGGRSMEEPLGGRDSEEGGGGSSGEVGDAGDEEANATADESTAAAADEDVFENDDFLEEPLLVPVGGRGAGGNNPAEGDGPIIPCADEEENRLEPGEEKSVLPPERNECGGPSAGDENDPVYGLLLMFDPGPDDGKNEDACGEADQDEEDNPAILVSAQSASTCTAGRSCRLSHPSNNGIQFRSWTRWSESRLVGRSWRSFLAV